MTYTNEELMELFDKLREGFALLCKNTEADDKIIAQLEKRIVALETRGFFDEPRQ